MDGSPCDALNVTGDRFSKLPFQQNDHEKEAMKLYPSTVGSLMNALVCPLRDIAYAISCFERFQSILGMEL